MSKEKMYWDIHDMRKNPQDVPPTGMVVLAFGKSGGAFLAHQSRNEKYLWDINGGRYRNAVAWTMIPTLESINE